MTLRRSAQLSLIALALSAGATALPMAANADTAVRVGSPTNVSFVAVQRVDASQLGDDPLVPYAARALAAWQRYGSSGDPKALAEFNGLRNRIATVAAQRVGADANTMRTAWAKADRRHQLALMVAFTQLGTPYHGFQSSPGKGFDCSGFTMWVWAQAGVRLERTSRAQIRSVANIEQGQAQAGDLVYYPGHITLYLGVDHYIIHSPQTGRSVEVASIRRHTVRFGNPLG